MWDQPIADFEKQNPGVKVIREIGPQSSTQLHDLITQKLKNRDTEMDVFVMDVIWPAEFASAGWALPLDRFFALAEQKQFLDAPIRANRYRGQIFGVPLFVDAGLLYYRKDLLEKYRIPPPRTWPELVARGKNDSGPGERSPTRRLLRPIQTVRGTYLQHDGIYSKQRRQPVG